MISTIKTSFKKKKKHIFSAKCQRQNLEFAFITSWNWFRLHFQWCPHASIYWVSTTCWLCSKSLKTCGNSGCRKPETDIHSMMKKNKEKRQCWLREKAVGCMPNETAQTCRGGKSQSEGTVSTSLWWEHIALLKDQSGSHEHWLKRLVSGNKNVPATYTVDANNIRISNTMLNNNNKKTKLLKCIYTTHPFVCVCVF